MGYALLLIESLAWSLLLVATVLACAGRLRRGWLRLTVALPVPLVLVIIHVALTIEAGLLEFAYGIGQWFYPMLALTVFFVAGTVWLFIKGLWRAETADMVVAAAWPRGKLAVSLAAAVALYCMTFWNLDLIARQQLAALRVEAGAAALSVAPPRVPDRDNAAFVYQQAFEAMGNIVKGDESGPGTWQWDDAWAKAWGKWNMWQARAEGRGKIDFDVHDPELRRFMSREVPALKLLRQAAAMPGCYFERDYGRPSIAMQLPELALLRTGARLLALDAVCHAADGNYRQALEDVNATFLMAEHIDSEPLLISTLVAVAVDHLAIDSLQIVLATNRVPANDLAAVRIPDNVSYRELLKRGLRGEEAMRLATFDDVGSGRIDVAQLAEVTGGNDGSNAFPEGLFGLVYRVFLLGDDLAAHHRFTAGLDQAARLPYWQAIDHMKQLDRQVRDKPGGILTAFLVPALGKVMVTVNVGDARRDAARLGVAIYAYRARNGRFPATLDDLIPEFIPTVPLDPFDGKPMKLRRTDHDLTVYSIGPEENDDGKSPFPLASERKKGEITFTLPDAGTAKK